jgi:hypothetical protein
MDNDRAEGATIAAATAAARQFDGAGEETVIRVHLDLL